ncbi:MAG TPA: hypothetical protein VKZ79_06765 [Alphaproteobacteria bacterium]|nr:hypothetical protein [Alphaproteobacteria bacterium]
MDDPAALAQSLSELKGRLIMFDGYPLAGKTTLVRDMAERLKCKGIDADDFLDRRRGSYVDALRFDELERKIRALTGNSQLALVASVCARAVAARLRVPDVNFVYVQRYNRPNFCSAPDTVNGTEDESSGVEKAGDEFGLYREVREYHKQFRPRCHADFIFMTAAVVAVPIGTGWERFFH